jgi:hypothetical protein
MDKSEKDKLSRYGKLVWDFANSKTTDDILTSYFENLQSVFNFSKDFPQKALTKYPTKQMMIGTLSSKEQNLLQLLLEKNNIWNEVNKRFAFHYFFLDGYDSKNRIFMFSEREWKPNDDPNYIDKTILIPEKEIEAYIDNSEIPDNDKDNTKATLKIMAKLCHKIEEIKSEATDRFEELQKIANDYEEILRIHDYVHTTQEKLKGILLQIIESDNAYITNGFKSILLRYNEIHKTIYVINDAYQLIEMSPFIEDRLIEIGLTRIDDSRVKASRFNGERVFNTPISYCLVEYLKNPEYSGKKRMAVCQKCNCIFSKSRLNDQQIYCPVCSRKNKMTAEKRADYMKKYRANPARIKAMAKKKREERIKQLMTNAGKTRKEAEIIVDDAM